MSTIDERSYYKNNPYFTGHIYGNFTPFYATIAVCTVIGVLVLLLNIICTCCSKYKHYWTDRHTGNRWLVSIWSATPHKQPPLDYTELEVVAKGRPVTTVSIFCQFPLLTRLLNTTQNHSKCSTRILKLQCQSINLPNLTLTHNLRGSIVRTPEERKDNSVRNTLSCRRGKVTFSRRTWASF